MAKPPYDPHTMSPTQEPEPLLCADCGEPAPWFYEGQICRACLRKRMSGDKSYEPLATLVWLDEQKQEHLEQYISALFTRAHNTCDLLNQIGRELDLINQGVSPTDIKHGTWPHLEEFQHED